MLDTEEYAVGPVGLVFLSRDAVVEDGSLGVAALGYSIGENAQGQGDGLTAAIAELHQPGKAQGIAVARPCAMEFTVVRLDLPQHQMDQARLFGIQRLDHAGPNPHPFFHLIVTVPVPGNWDQRELHEAGGSPALDFDDALADMEPIQEYLVALFEKQSPFCGDL